MSKKSDEIIEMEKKSPIRKPSLPQAGESSWAILEDRWFSKASSIVLIPSFLAIIATIEWSHRLFQLPVNPWLWTVFFVFSLPFSLAHYRRGMNEMALRHQGIQGERIVGQSLENLRSMGCRIFHDIEEKDYNIDHVVIAPNGIFAIETKAPSKPAKGQSSVVFDGESVTLTGERPDRDTIIQAKSVASRLRQIIQETTGQEHRVIPVVLYVNWFVESRVFRRDLFVMNQDYFIKAFANLGGADQLPPDTIKFLAAGIEQYLANKRK